MGTGTLRFAIILALVVGGVLLIDRAFPEGRTESLPRPSDSSPAPTETETPRPTKTEQPDEEETPPAGPKRVVVAVYNGTFVDFFAGNTAEEIEKRNRYQVVDVGDVDDKPVETTTLYYRDADDRAAAETLATELFEDIEPDITKMPADFQTPERVRVAIYLGTDLV